MGETLADDRDPHEETASRDATRAEIEELTRQMQEFGVSLSDVADNCPNNDGVTDYNDTDYNDTDYGSNNDGVTDYNDTNYGDHGNTNYDDGSDYDRESDDNWDDGDSGYDD